MFSIVPTPLRALVETLSARSEVVAIALGGSRASQQADNTSDYDVYVFMTSPVSHETRRNFALQFDPNPEIGNSWWGDEDAWQAESVDYDVSFWDAKTFEDNLHRIIERHQPSLGYSTSFWFTVRNALPLFDRNGWLAWLKTLAETPYPDELRNAIITLNAPVLRTAHASYRHQIEIAVERDDPVSVNHRVAALLASVFDILFALNRTLHPGEKRQLAWLASLGDAVPATVEHDIRELLVAAGHPALVHVMSAVDALCDDIEQMVASIDRP